MQHSFNLMSETLGGDLAFADYAYPTSAVGWNGLVLVGEAPGAEEARLGRPFVGRSGQLLDKVLIKAEINRDACLIANVFRFRPPANKVDHFFISKRNAKEQGIDFCETYGKFGSGFVRSSYAGELENLRKMLVKEKPKVIIALGRTPFWALTGENALMTHVGKTLPCRLDKSFSVIPTFHPSFILRGNWKLQDKWLTHFMIAKSLAK